jgi:hypothetical protein
MVRAFIRKIARLQKKFTSAKLLIYEVVFCKLQSQRLKTHCLKPHC